MGRATIHGYAAAKSALAGLARSLAAELGEDGITCNSIAPGYFETDLTRPAAGQRGLRRPRQQLGGAAAVGQAARPRGARGVPGVGGEFLCHRTADRRRWRTDDHHLTVSRTRVTASCGILTTKGNARQERSSCSCAAGSTTTPSTSCARTPRACSTWRFLRPRSHGGTATGRKNQRSGTHGKTSGASRRRRISAGRRGSA
jgi:hypothetical protein